MATRGEKLNVEYFSHWCIHNDNLSIVESKYGYIGYCVYYKTMELLGLSDYHYYDCRSKNKWYLLLTKIGAPLDEDNLHEIYSLFSELEIIDPYLWKLNILWSKDFYEQVKYAYIKRRNKLPSYQDLCKIMSVECNINSNSINTPELHSSTPDGTANSPELHSSTLDGTANSQTKTNTNSKTESESKVTIMDHTQTFENYVQEMKNSRDILESVCRDFKIDLKTAEKHLDEFLKIRKAKKDWNFKTNEVGKKILKSLDDSRSHFYSWTDIQIKKNKSSEPPRAIPFKPNRITG